MNTKVACSKCTYFDSHSNENGVSAQDHGLCRFNPPVTQRSASEHGLWPVVSTTDWCGHFSAGGALAQVAAE